MVASCSSDRTIRLWDAETGACLRTLSGHGDTVSCVAFSPQGNQIVSGSYDQTVWIWDVDSGSSQYFITGYANCAYRIAFSPKGNQFASACYFEVGLWNTTTEEDSGRLGNDIEGIISVTYSPDGNLIAAGSRNGTIWLWNVGTMAFINTLIGHDDWVCTVDFSPPGDQLASAGDDCTVRLWSVATGVCCRILIGHDRGVSKVAYSHKGELLASGSWDKTVRLWDAASGQCRAVVQILQGYVNGVAWIPSTDANFLVTGCQDGSVLKWQVTEEEGQHHVTLCWSATSGSLTVTGASIQDVRGLSSINKQLLKQRGVVGEPEKSFREVGKKAITMATVVSRMKLPSERIVPPSPSITNTSDGHPQRGDQEDEWQDEQQLNSSHKRRYRKIVRRARW
jgi:WD40 repeat protein